MKERSETHREAVLDWAGELAQHTGWLRSVVAARTGEPQVVDEIMQEVAVAALKQQAPLRERGKIAPWLYQVAVRQSLQYRRSRGRRRRREEQYADLGEQRQAQRRTGDPLDWLLAEERRNLLRNGMSKLRPKEAEILLLKYTEDWSYAQIASHLGISESAVESRLHRARQRLRDELTAYHESEGE